MNYLPLNTHNHATFLSLNICLVVQKITYLSFFYVSIKQKRNDQLIKPYKKKNIQSKKETKKHDNSISTFYISDDEQNKKKKTKQKKMKNNKTSLIKKRLKISMQSISI
jgi:hypothetical protein